jgi:chemotaxis protein MotB
VMGHADRVPLLPAEPFAAANRRVSVTLLRAAPAPAAYTPETAPR